MRRSTLFAVIGGTIIIGLVLLNIWLTLQERYNVQLDLRSSFEQYEKQDIARTNQIVADAVAQIKTIEGTKGDTGATGMNGSDGLDGISTKGEKGDSGDAGKPGKDAKPIVLSTDTLTGDILWQYEGDTLWTLLIEKCELKGECDD